MSEESGSEFDAADLLGRVEAAAGKKVSSMTPVDGGYTQAVRRIVAFSDGGTAFLKGATDERTSRWLIAEANVYQQVNAGFLPDLLAVDLDDMPFLLLEDLTPCDWVPSWSTSRIDAVLGCLEDVRSTQAELPEYGEMFTQHGWHAVAVSPESFLSMGLVTEAWLNDCLPILIEAKDSVPTTGSDLLHLDLRSDNLCFRKGQAVLFDWNNACFGNGEVDLGFWLPSLFHEGGPCPTDILPDSGGIAAYVTGYFAEVAGKPGDGRIRQLQRDMLSAGLAWMIKALRLPDPF